MHSRIAALALGTMALLLPRFQLLVSDSLLDQGLQ
jgi:hypothetical protein